AGAPHLPQHRTALGGFAPGGAALHRGRGRFELREPDGHQDRDEQGEHAEEHTANLLLAGDRRGTLNVHACDVSLRFGSAWPRPSREAPPPDVSMSVPHEARDVTRAGEVA